MSDKKEKSDQDKEMRDAEQAQSSQGIIFMD
jgi:hypothetical protein